MASDLVVDRPVVSLDPAERRRRTLDHWAREVDRNVPGAAWLFVRPFIYLLASPASPDTLLIVADALDQAAQEARLTQLPRALSMWPRQVASLLRDEAPRRA